MQYPGDKLIDDQRPACSDPITVQLLNYDYI